MREWGVGGPGGNVRQQVCLGVPGWEVGCEGRACASYLIRWRA